MTPVRSSDGSDVFGMSRSGEPIVHGRPDFSPLHGRFAWPMMAGDQQQDSFTAVNRLIESAIDCIPCAIEAHPVEIEHAIGLDIAGSQSAVPTSVQRHAVVRLGPRRGRLRETSYGPRGSRLWIGRPRLFVSRFFRDFLTR